jgi:hypothetical protein
MSLIDSIKRRFGKGRPPDDEPDAEPRPEKPKAPAAEQRPSEPCPEKAEKRRRLLSRFKLPPIRRPGWARIPRPPRAVRVGAGMELASSGKINPGV